MWHIIISCDLPLASDPGWATKTEVEVVTASASSGRSNGSAASGFRSFRLASSPNNSKEIFSYTFVKKTMWKKLQAQTLCKNILRRVQVEFNSIYIIMNKGQFWKPNNKHLLHSRKCTVLFHQHLRLNFTLELRFQILRNCAFCCTLARFCQKVCAEFFVPKLIIKCR